MSWAYATSPCFGCGRVFSYNPIHVPSIRINANGQPAVGRLGTREPICEACVTAVNPRRIANGLPPIVPHPDAYEPCREEELP
jgi:hypothetical protein